MASNVVARMFTAEREPTSGRWSFRMPTATWWPTRRPMRRKLINPEVLVFSYVASEEEEGRRRTRGRSSLRRSRRRLAKK